jgi:predicted transcriptional regulator
MKKKSLDNLGELQEAIMEVVWAMGEATSRHVQERLSQKRPLAYTSVLSIMQRLEKAGWLRHRTDQRTYVYQPAFSRDQESRRSLGHFIERVFHGNSQLVIQHLIEQGDLSEEDLLALQKLINRKRRERK